MIEIIFLKNHFNTKLINLNHSTTATIKMYFKGVS